MIVRPEGTVVLAEAEEYTGSVHMVNSSALQQPQDYASDEE